MSVSYAAALIPFPRNLFKFLCMYVLKVALMCYRSEIREHPRCQQHAGTWTFIFTCVKHHSARSSELFSLRIPNTQHGILASRGPSGSLCWKCNVLHRPSPSQTMQAVQMREDPITREGGPGRILDSWVHPSVFIEELLTLASQDSSWSKSRSQRGLPASTALVPAPTSQYWTLFSSLKVNLQKYKMPSCSEVDKSSGKFTALLSTLKQLS